VTSSPPLNKNDCSRPRAGGASCCARSWRHVVATPRRGEKVVERRARSPACKPRSGRWHAGARTKIWMSPKSCVTPPRIPRFARRSDEKLRKTGRSTIGEGDIWPDAKDLSAKCTHVSRETSSAEGGILADGKCAVRIKRPRANPAPTNHEPCRTPIVGSSFLEIELDRFARSCDTPHRLNDSHVTNRLSPRREDELCIVIRWLFY
jgi:hypothetical protein